MTVSARRLLSSVIDDLKKERDELSLQIHLGKREVKAEWKLLVDKLDELNHRYEPLKDAAKESSEDVWDALRFVAEEVKAGFHRIRKSLSS